MTQCPRATRWVAFFVVSFLSSLFAIEGNPDFQFRAFWLVRTSMTSRAEIDKALRFAAENNFNHLFVQVRGRDDAFYESRLVPRNEMIIDGSLDPLNYALRRGHELGLKIHAWMNVYLVWSARQLPETRGHILKRYPEWEDKSRTGYSSHRFLSPAHPGVREYLLMVFEEVLTRYDVDGLHLDYIRYGDVDYGYSLATRSGFEELYGVDPISLVTENPSGDGSHYLWQQWNQYRRDTVTELVRSCNSLILDLVPNCLLSAAVKADPADAKQRYYQEWDRWLAEGLVDFVVPMNYTPNLREFAHNIDRIYESIPTKFWPGIIMGIAAYNQNAMDARDKIRYTRVVGFSGVSIFSYDSHKNQPEFFLPLVEEILR